MRPGREHIAMMRVGERDRRRPVMREQDRHRPQVRAPVEQIVA